MKTVISLVTTAVLVAALSPGIFADDKDIVVRKNSELIGKVIKNKTGDHLGYLEDLVIDRHSGQIAYAAVSTKNSLGLGGKLYALPLSAFSMAGDFSHLIADLSKNAFENDPGFESNRWPDRMEPRWAKLATRPEAKMGKEARLVRLTSLNGLPVRNFSADDLGKVQGFSVDCTHDKINYVAMSHGGVVGIGSKYFAIPWQALALRSLNLRAQDCSFVLNASKQEFDNAAGFDTNNWPNAGDPAFLKNARKAPADSR